MKIEIRTKVKPTITAEYQTATVVAALLAGAGAWNAWRGHPGRAALAILIGLTLLAAAGCSATFAGRVHRGWMRVARTMGAVNTFVLLALVYLLGFSVYGRWVRLTRRDALGRRSPARPTYWIHRARTHPHAWQFEKLY